MADHDKQRAFSEKSPLFFYQIEKSRNDQDILVINNRYIHSKFQPRKEAVHFKCRPGSLVAIFGLGLAYHVNNIILNNPDSYFIIYEPHPEIYQMHAQYIDPQILELHKDRLLLLCQLDNAGIFHFITQKIKITSRLQTYSNTGYKNLFSTAETAFYQIVKNSLELFIQNRMTESNFVPMWSRNLIYNISRCRQWPILDLKQQDRAENLAVIACAGPSLEKDLPRIKKLRSHLTLFAVDTAIKPLLYHQIYPDFVISLDGQYYSLYDFVPAEQTKGMHFIFDLLAYPGLFHTFFPAANASHLSFTVNQSAYPGSLLQYYFEGLGLKPALIETGGTVADYALHLALQMGFKCFYFTGLDLSFPALLTHSRKTPYHDLILNQADYYQPALTQIAKIISRRNLLPGQSRVKGKKVLSDFVLKNYALYFEEYAKSQPSNHCFYYSPDNALNIDRFCALALDRIPAIGQSQRIYWEQLLISRPLFIDEKQLHDFNCELLGRLFSISKKLAAFLETIDFSSNDAGLINQCRLYLQDLYQQFCFLKKFAVMTEVILTQKNIGPDHLVWYKHLFFKLLQSIYFLIRTLQKTSR